MFFSCDFVVVVDCFALRMLDFIVGCCVCMLKDMVVEGAGKKFKDAIGTRYLNKFRKTTLPRKSLGVIS